MRAVLPAGCPAKFKGFSLLEAIVALVIFASVASALYAWVGVTLNSLNRVEAARQADEATAVALAWLETVNPMAQPEGEAAVGHYRVSWQAEAIAPELDGMTPEGGLSLFRVGLYELAVAVEGGAEPVRFRVRRAGWEQVRQPATEF